MPFSPKMFLIIPCCLRRLKMLTLNRRCEAQIWIILARNVQNKNCCKSNWVVYGEECEVEDWITCRDRVVDWPENLFLAHMHIYPISSSQNFFPERDSVTPRQGQKGCDTQGVSFDGYDGTRISWSSGRTPIICFKPWPIVGFRYFQNQIGMILQRPQGFRKALIGGDR